jgi:hypothetical protein
MKRAALSIAIAAGIALVTGCQPTTNTFQLINYRHGGGTERFQQQFDECYYSVHSDGNVEIVAQRRSRELGASKLDVTQILHVRTLYRAIPGRTAVDRSMINASITYAIVSDAGGACYEGGGFLTGRQRNGKAKFVGHLEDAKLHPSRSVGDAPGLFDLAQLHGHFTARRDRARVVAILNELDRLFGPRPRYEPPAVGLDTP